MDLFGAALLLFLVMDPLGNIPIFLSVLEKVAPERRYRVLIRELLLALAIMVGFLLAGQYLMAFLQLSSAAVSIAGGIILFLIAVKMIFPVPRAMREEDEEEGEPLLVPLAVPLVAGPSLLAVILLLVTNQPDRIGWWGVAMFSAWLVSALILLTAPTLQRMLGNRVITAMERLMGMLLVALAVQMFLDGIKDALIA